MKTMNTTRTGSHLRVALKHSALAASMACCLASQAQAAAIPVPNGSFETLYKPGETTITADTGSGWTQGVGPNAAMEGGTATYSDATTGSAVDIPGWVNAPETGTPPDGGWAPPYDWPKGSGTIDRNNATPYGSYYYSGNPSNWGNPYGAAIESDAALTTVASGENYTLTMSGTANDVLGPVVLDLLADGVILTPTSSVTAPDGTWTLYTNTYAAASLTGVVGQSLKIRVGWAVGANGGGQGHLDNVQLWSSVSDATAPTLTSFVDNKAGGPINENESVTYTVTFSEPMNASTVNAADFTNADPTAMTVNSVTPTGDPAVFLVIATPTAPGTLQLQITAGATLTDLDGNALDTSAAIPDDTLITVNEVAHPLNDNFADAIDLTGLGSGQTGDAIIGTQTGTDNVNATLESGEPGTVTYPGGGTSSFNNTVWFKWTCPADGNLTVSTLGSTDTTLPTPGEYDAVLGIYTGTSANAPTPLGASPQDTGLEEIMTVPVTAGTTYSIQVAGWNSSVAANIVLKWTLVPTNGAVIQAFGPGATIGTVVNTTATIAWTVPYGTNLATLAPTFTLSPGATCTVGGLTVNSGDPADLSSPVDYTVTSSDSLITNVYTVTATWGPASTACDITSFGTNVAGSSAVITTTSPTTGTVAWSVPYIANVADLAPTYTLSAGATCPQPNPGVPTPDFSTSPVVYLVTAQDGSTTKTYDVTVTVAPDESALIWNTTNGAWDLSTPNWLGQTSGSPLPFFNALNVIFNNPSGGTVTIASGMAPASTTVSAGNYIFRGQPIAAGPLTKSGGGQLSLEVTPANFSSIAVNGGTLYVHAADHYLGDGSPFNMGTGTVTVESGATLLGERANMAGSLIMNGGRYFENNGFSGSWTGPVYLAADSFFGQNGWCMSQTINGEISGPGGFTFSTNYGAVLTLTSANTYDGPTIVTSGTVKCNNSASLGNGGTLDIRTGAKVDLNYTGEHNVASLTLGGTPQSGGTYGSTSSGADHPNDTYFAGTGMVRVPASPLCNMLTFSFGALGAGSIGDTTIILEVPYGTDRSNLAPTYTVSPGATCSPDSGTSLNFTSTQSYTVTAEDGITTKTYLVTVTEAVLADIFTWTTAVSGDWNDSTKWTNELATGSGPLAAGRESYTLNFTTAGTYTATNNLSAGFMLNQLNLSSTLTLAGNSLAFVANGATLPTINQNSGSQVTIPNDLALGADTTVGGSGNGWVILSGLISGDGSLTKDGPSTLRMAKANSYTGGTFIKNGTLLLEWPGDGVSHATLGSGSVTLDGGTLWLNRTDLANDLTVNGGSLVLDNGFGSAWTGPITLNAPNLNITSYYSNHPFSGPISGSGGFTLSGSYGGGLALSGTNDYTGPTTVNSGTLVCNNVSALGGGDLSISSSGSAKVNLNYSGTRAITSLTLGGVAQTLPGTYGSVASVADFQNDTYFAGTGTVTLGTPAPQAYISSFGTNVTGSSAVIGEPVANAATIAWTVPYGTVLADLAPTFTMSTDATCDQTSGAIPTPDFSAGGPVDYTVTSSDAAIINVYTVTVTVAPEPSPVASVTYDLGTSPAGTTINGAGASTLFVWAAKGSLPVGSILRSVTATAVKLESNPSGSWASDLGVFVDPTPGTPGGPGGLLCIADDSNFGGAAQAMNWNNQGQNDGPMTTTLTAGTQFVDTIDLNTAAVMIGSAWGTATWSGTITVAYDGVGNDIVAFGLPGNPAVITLAPGANTIALTVPYPTDVSSLAPAFIMSDGATCVANGAPVVSGVTTIDFTDPVVYTVTAADSTTNDYTVTVTVTGGPPPPFSMALTGNGTSGTLMENNEADGYRFQTGDTVLTVNWLGLYDAPNDDLTGTVGDGLQASHRVSIWLESDGTLVAQTTVLTTDALQGNFRGRNIPAVTLAANTGYVIAADYGGTGDRQWEGANTAEWGVYSGISNLAGRYGGPGGGMPTGEWGVMVGPNFGNTVVVGGYGTWASTNAPGQTPGQDYDNDGVANGIEYFMGATGSSFTAMPGLDGTNTVTWPKDPAYSGTWQVQTSPDLATWTDVAGTDNGTSVSYTLPAGAGKLFVRLLVTPN